MTGGKLKAPIAGMVYGQIVYWGVMLGCLIVIIGSIISFTTRDNFVPVSYWLSTVWKGASPSQIWQGITGSLPMGHWYFSHLTTGDGLTALGISLSVFSVVPALLLSSAVLFKEGDMLYGILTLICGVIVLTGVLGLIPIG
jgi:hypothetical protein